ncbi:MAG: hypothetical protein [Cressdnaviricota sp.]|nr:MAG: hypothetical protein [Cressdnaviricota sp.]
MNSPTSTAKNYRRDSLTSSGTTSQLPSDSSTPARAPTCYISLLLKLLWSIISLLVRCSHRTCASSSGTPSPSTSILSRCATISPLSSCDRI